MATKTRSSSRSSRGRKTSSRLAAASSRRSTGSSRTASAKTTTDHDKIRQWAEQRGAKPTCVLGTGGGGDTGVLRLDFPGFSGAGSLHEVSWDEWFEKFDDNNLALLYQDKTKSGRKSNFNKIVDREQSKSRGRHGRG
jgi:hypothetical protein